MLSCEHMINWPAPQCHWLGIDRKLWRKTLIICSLLKSSYIYIFTRTISSFQLAKKICDVREVFHTCNFLKY